MHDAAENAKAFSSLGSAAYNVMRGMCHRPLPVSIRCPTLNLETRFRPTSAVDRARRLHSTLDSIKQVEKDSDCLTCSHRNGFLRAGCRLLLDWHKTP